MFHHRHQLDVGEAEVLDVVDQVLGQVAVALALAPGPEMDLVDAHGSVVRVGRRTRGHPVAVLPRVCRGRHHRGGRRRLLGGTGHRVRLGPSGAVGAEDLELVAVALGHARDEELPDAGGAQRAHGVDRAVPLVEVTDEADRARVGRPHREGGAANGSHRSVVLAHMCAQNVPELFVAALADRGAGRSRPGSAGTGRGRREGARSRRRRRPGSGSPGPVAVGRTPTQTPFELMAQLGARAISHLDKDAVRQRFERAHGDGAVVGVGPKDGVRVVMCSGDQPLELAGGRRACTDDGGDGGLVVVTVADRSFVRRTVGLWRWSGC